MSSAKENTNNDPYQRFLEKKHESFKTPEDVIETIVKKATGSGLSECTRIIDGEDNEVYGVTTDKNQKIIVRISRREINTFESEEKVIRLAKMVGVPAPKVLLIEKVPASPKSLTFCVEEKIEGTQLKKLMDSENLETLKPLIIESGEILSKINSITVEGYGLINEGGRFRSWGDFIFSLEEEKDKVIKAGKVVGVKSDLIERAFKILRENEKMFRVDKPSLLHGDFSPKHLLVKDNHIVGIIDFEQAKGGDPVRDFAWINYFYEDTYPIDWVKEGYSNKNLFDKNFDLKMKLYRLHLGLDLLGYFGSEENEAGLNFTKNRFIKELQNF